MINKEKTAIGKFLDFKKIVAAASNEASKTVELLRVNGAALKNVPKKS